MSPGNLQDLKMPRPAARLYVIAFIVLSAGFLLLGAIAATDEHWLVLLGASVALLAVLVFAAGEGYRLRPALYGRVEVHTLFRVRRLDLTNGFEVKQGRLGRRVVRIKTPKGRARLSGSLGGPIVVREWLEVAAAQ